MRLAANASNDENIVFHGKRLQREIKSKNILKRKGLEAQNRCSIELITTHLCEQLA